MGNWEIKVFNENEELIKKDTIESDSKYFVKKIANNMTQKTEGGASFSFKKMEDDEENK